MTGGCRLGRSANAEGDAHVKRWFALSSQAALLGLQAQSVITLRLMRLAAGGALAQARRVRMITEEVAALREAQSAAAMATSREATAAKSPGRCCAFPKEEFVETGGGSLSEPCSGYNPWLEPKRGLHLASSENFSSRRQSENSLLVAANTGRP